jgi:hypothetical protein
MSNGKLIFTPAPDVPPPERLELERRLREIGFLGSAIDTERFLVGERFMQWVSFMGCSPWLRLAPTEDDNEPFTHIRFQGPLKQPLLRYGNNTRPPRCPHCRRRIDEWESRLPTREGPYPCPHCGETTRLDDLVWSNDAGHGRFFIEVWEIFPGEAVPVEGLMQRLRQEGGEWRYFYLQQ